jgi:DNA-binding MarR family transcriptional regulator
MKAYAHYYVGWQLNQTQHAMGMAVTPQSFYRIAIALERCGLIQRVRKADNQKPFYLRFTTEGKQLEERAEAPLKIVQDKLKSQFTTQELVELYKLLVKFEAAFKNTNNAQEAKE